jgi:hypothetical protein
LRHLEVEECVNWIFHELIFDKGFDCRHSRAQGWEFLVFTATDYLLNAKKLQKLERLTGLILLQIETNDGNSKYGSGDWPSHPVLGIRLLPIALWARREMIPTKWAK